MRTIPFAALALTLAQLAPSPLALAREEGPLATLTDCSLSGWDTSRAASGDSLELASYADGSCALWTRISPGDGQINLGHRAEIRDPFVAPARSLVRYEFDLLIPSATHGATKSLVLAQWHDVRRRGFTGRPPLSLRLADGRLRAVLFNDAIHEASPLGSGLSLGQVAARGQRWLRIKATVRWSAGSDGSAEILVNGRPLANYRGPIGYAADPLGPYLKLGVYTVHELQGPADALYRNFRRARLD